MHKAFFKIYLSKLIFLWLIVFVNISCNNIPEKNWLKAIPEYVPAVVIPGQNANFSTVMRSEYLPFLEDISTSPIATISKIENVSNIPILLKGMAIFPTQAEDWKPLWIGEAKEGILTALAPNFEKDLSVNSYDFKSTRIHLLSIDKQTLYAAQLNQWVLFSESSYAIEEALRTYLNDLPSLDIDESSISNEGLVLNAPFFDRWLAQLGAPRHRTKIRDAFKGTKAGVFHFSKIDENGADNLSVTGSLPLAGDKTKFVASISQSNAEVVLDRYIPADAASFAILNHKPELHPPKDIPATSKLDSMLLSDVTLYRNIAEALHPSFAYVTFQASGFLSVGENLYMRQLKDHGALNRIMQDLVSKGIISQSNNLYTLESKVLADLLSNSLSGYDFFTLTIDQNAAVFSQRPGLTTRVNTDRERRRVMYYNDQYSDIRTQFPNQVSGFFYAKSAEYLNYLKSVLNPVNYATVVASRFDIVAFSLSLDESANNLNLNLQTFRTKESDQPYKERWIFSMEGTDLTGSPLLANLGNSTRVDIIISTEDGRVFALGPDGSTVFQTDTGTDTPIGQPLIYDWYGNDQKTILIAAGNKVYAWNNRGIALPNFPIVMNEQITAPIQIGDVSRNGRPELIVATADRKIHILNGRGENINGWPQSTNSPIASQPVFKEIKGIRSVWAYAENGLFAWNTTGRLREGYPVFIESAFKGDPLFYKDNIIAAAADGYLYSIGETKIFDDSLSRESQFETVSLDENKDNSNIQRVYVSNSSLVNTPLIQVVHMQNKEVGNIREEMIITQSSGGSIFFFNTRGQLRMVKSMGQPADVNYKPVLHDINNSGSPEIMALAGFGRLFAWNSRTSERFQDLPTSAMSYPIFADIYGDGRTEIIAKTREGLRCWTIMP
ncbi:MAG: hypothetical protein WD267_06075 [Balneolales bacterium]